MVLSMLFFACTLVACAQTKAPYSGDYYKSADGKKGKNLKTALYTIINDHRTITYDGLWDCYKTTDVREDGKIWDMYSNATNYVPGGSAQGHSYSKEGDSYNREHSFPKSWFNEASPMKSDLVHVVPTDGYVNNRRSNYPFGETKGESYKSANGFSKVGKCTYPGYAGTVFEPNDEYKGDFARIYFYMVTCYESRVSTWNSEMLAGNSYPAFSSWALNMLLEWAEKDPVSQKEIDRNNEVYSLQHNRNPFVDYPGLEQYVWGSATNVAFSYNNYQQIGGGTTPDNPGPDNPDTPDTPDNPDNPDTPIVPSEGEQVFRRVAAASQLEVGKTYLIVMEDGSNSQALSDISGNGNYYLGSSVTITNNQIATEVDNNGRPHQLVLGGSKGAYTLYDVAGNGYLSVNSNSNHLNLSTSITDNSLWNIEVTSNKVVITNGAYPSRSIQYNKSAPRFASYTSVLTAVTLYVNEDSADRIPRIDAARTMIGADIYNVQGRKVGKIRNGDNLKSLPRGIYVVNGKKYVK